MQVIGLNCHKIEGITIVELMILSAIIAILVMIIGQNIFGINNESTTIQVAQNLRSIDGAIRVYYNDLGSYPDNENGLNFLIEKENSRHEEKWNGPYLNESLLIDPWGNAYYYELMEEEYKIYTLGEDGKIGGSNLNEDLSLISPRNDE